MNSYALSFDCEAVQDAPVMGNAKWSQDWKFWLQIVTIAMLAGIAWQENRQMQHKVEGLEQKVDGLYRANQEKTETLIRMEGKFDLLNRDNKDLKDMIQRLEQRLESKKVVNISGSSDPIVGDRYIEK